MKRYGLIVFAVLFGIGLSILSAQLTECARAEIPLHDAHDIKARVVVCVFVTAEGKVGTMQIAMSSGIPPVDAYALEFLQDEDIQYPTQVDANGMSVPFKVNRPIVINFKDAPSALLANPIRNPQPKLEDYPDVKTQTALEISLDAEGNVLETKVISSSGSELYDVTAAEIVKTGWKFPPARRKKKAVMRTTSCVIYFGYRPGQSSEAVF
ncbi:energy transducer TonB [Selenomonas artemidis]|jgi:hypothetical protein|uniref:energy transducer TonB n=1 Tax=Selenomonas artemidis TaxID=671224 RepID=UPI0023EFD936|nr:energy transducer TonB [Selenomonas artemidis]